MSGYPAFTSSYSGLSRRLINQVQVSPAIDTKGRPIVSFSEKLWNAQWDTGATDTCITKAVANELGLCVVTQKNMHTPSGNKITDCYAAHILLPGKVLIKNLCVLEGILTDCDILIGMDIIVRGDFAVSNFGNKTIFTYRVPSLMSFDFVKKTYLVPHVAEKEPGRNDPCFCGSGKKYKECHGVK